MTRLVYSTGPDGEGGRTPDACPRCGAGPCRCEETTQRPPGKQSIVVRRDRRGRRGKTVTLAGPFHLPEPTAAALLKGLKRLCGCGGTLRQASDAVGQTMEIQGDQVVRVAEHLASLGYKVRQAGQ